MRSVVEVMKSMPDYIGSNGRSEEEIRQAEQLLGTTFAPDYRQYLKEIGLACFDGHELTGITKVKRVNVVDVTLEEHGRNSDIPSGWYVVEQANIDGIVIWQDKSGIVSQSSPTQSATQIAQSLAEYLVK